MYKEKKRGIDMRTVGELKNLIKDLSDDMMIVHFDNNMEKFGCFPNVTAKVERRSPVEKQTWDRFDGTDYTYESYERDDENGQPCLVLY